MSNKNLSLKEISIVRRKAVEAVVKEKVSQKRASELFGFCVASMSKYVKAYKACGEASFEYEKRGVKKESGRYLSSEQESRLVKDILKTTPDEIGLEFTLWTSKVVKTYINKNFSINFSERGIRKLMNRLGFSAQKPIKLAYERDHEKVAIWLEETYPKIKARASQEGARIYWGDEMGLQSTDNRGRTYGLVGKTPVIKRPATRFKANILAASSPQGFMNWMVFKENFTTKKFIEFLGRMQRQIQQKIFLIVDNHPIHRSSKVQRYLQKTNNKLELFFLPPYSPDLNPQELINQDIKANANNFKPLSTTDNLFINARYYLTKIQFSPSKIMAFFNNKKVAFLYPQSFNNLVPA